MVVERMSMVILRSNPRVVSIGLDFRPSAVAQKGSARQHCRGAAAARAGAQQRRQGPQGRETDVGARDIPGARASKEPCGCVYLRLRARGVTQRARAMGESAICEYMDSSGQMVTGPDE